MATFSYFTLKELCSSQTAKEKNIDNFPSFTTVEHLSELTEKILEPLRIAWGSAIRVTSGYRCEELNTAVKGALTSAHKSGYAADLQPSNGKIDDFGAFVKKWLENNNVMFDQALFERSGGTKWVHISLYSSNHTQRREVKDLVV